MSADPRGWGNGPGRQPTQGAAGRTLRAAGGRTARTAGSGNRALAAFAWTGGVLFVASLAYFLYFYLLLLGLPPLFTSSSSTVQAVGLNVLLFGIFALHHSVMARTGAKRALTRLLPEAAERSVYVWVASLLFLFTCTSWRRVPGEMYWLRGPAGWVLTLAQVAGFVFIARAAAALDVLDLAGIRHARAADTARATSGASVALRDTGVFGFVRHPLYLGWILLTWCAPHMTADRLLFAAISAAYVLAAIPFEERSLVESFGEPYRGYMKRVRWRVLPGLY